jgi:stage II sporulation protein M
LMCWNFLVECRWFVVGVVGLFCLSFLVGFVCPIFYVEEIFEMIRELVFRFDGLSVWGTIWLIFTNNLMASGVAMMLGVFVGVFPLVSCVINGYLVGFVGRYAVEAEGIWSLWRLLPHGVFELPAVLISMGIGLKLGWSVVAGHKSLKKNLREGLRFFGFVVVPLLVVAAVIEGVLVFIG